MCGAPGSTEAGDAPLRQASTERARALLKESGYKGEPIVFLHAQTSALLGPIGLVIADQLKRAGFNVDLRSTDYATVAQKRLSRAPADQGGWNLAPLVLNGIDMANPLNNPLLSFNCSPVSRASTVTPRSPSCSPATPRRQRPRRSARSPTPCRRRRTAP